MDRESESTVPLMGWTDLGVFVGMLAVSTSIGCYFGCRPQVGVSQEDEYLRGGKTMSVVPVAMSLVASLISGITVLGVPSEIYRYGTQYAAVLISCFIMSYTTATAFVPLYMNLKLNSSYQYLELRFSCSVRRLASILFLFQQILYIPIVIYVPAIAFSQVTGINVHIITPITSLVCIFYTTFGGLRAVVWTDALQALLMIASQLVVLYLGSQQLGGWSQVWQINEKGERLEFFNMDPNPLKRHTFWTVLIGSYNGWLATMAVGQGMVQRYLSLPHTRDAKWALFYFSFGLFLSKLLSMATGLLVYAHYADCDPLTTKRAERPDQLSPLYVLEVAGHIPGLSGLFVAGVFSAALSSMSTGVNALSGVLVEDLLATVLPPIISKGAWLRLFSVLIGVVCVLLVFVVERLGGVLQATLSLGGITGGAMLGLFLLGMLCPRATSKVALWSAIMSLLLTSFVTLGAQASIASGALRHDIKPMSVDGCAGNYTLPSLPPSTDDAWPIFRLSYFYFGVMGTLLVLVIGSMATLIFGGKPTRPEYLHPIARRWLQRQSDVKFTPEIRPLQTYKENRKQSLIFIAED